MQNSRNIVGQRNIGNTCYINAVLQCIASVPQISLFPNVVNETDTKNNHLRARFILSLSIFIKSIQDSVNAVMVPHDLKACLDDYKPFCKGNNMHDSHEILGVILDVFLDLILVSLLRISKLWPKKIFHHHLLFSENNTCIYKHLCEMQ